MRGVGESRGRFQILVPVPVERMGWAGGELVAAVRVALVVKLQAVLGTLRGR
jgi:hypothetical protein